MKNTKILEVVIIYSGKNKDFNDTAIKNSLLFIMQNIILFKTKAELFKRNVFVMFRITSLSL